MQFAVVCLDIDEEGVRHADDLLQIFLGHGEAGVHRRVDARRMQRGEQFAAEIRLQKRFAARQRDAAARVVVERLVLDQLRQEFIRRCPLAVKNQRVGKAGTLALAARDAFCAVKAMHAADDAVRAGRAGGGAAPAAGAFVRIEAELRLCGQPLRVVAPAAAQGAALEKQRGAHAVAVVNFKAFDVDIGSRCHMVLRFKHLPHSRSGG